MRKLPLTSLAGVVFVVLFFDGGQVSNVHIEALEIRDSSNQTNSFAGYPATDAMLRWPHGCCVNNFYRTGYVVTPGVGAHKLFKHKVTWNTARDICVREGAQLAVINSEAEEALFRRWKTNNNVLGSIWLGVHSLFERDWWVTLLGEPVAATTYNPWAKDHPNNTCGTRNCGVLSATPANGIANFPCNWKFVFICEINPCEGAEIVDGNLPGTPIA